MRKLLGRNLWIGLSKMLKSLCIKEILWHQTKGLMKIMNLNEQLLQHTIHYSEMKRNKLLLDVPKSFIQGKTHRAFHLAAKINLKIRKVALNPQLKFFLQLLL